MPAAHKPEEGQPPPSELFRASELDHHSEVVMEVRDITKPRKYEFPMPTGTDTAWRIVFPITYDRVLDQAEGIESGEDE